MVEESARKRLAPVAGGSSGEGLPYAPQDWPKVGDKWKWKVGKRSAHSGHWLDRYLYLPKRLQRVFGRRTFASKQAVAAFVKKEFPDTDVESFFASFSWVVPCSGGPLHIGTSTLRFFFLWKWIMRCLVVLFG